MKAVLRLGLAIAAAGLWLGQAPAVAQSTPPATTNTPAAETVGPRELENFSLQGTVTKPAGTAPAPRPATPASRSTTTSKRPESVAAAGPEPRASHRAGRIEQPQTNSPQPAQTASAPPAPQLPITPSESSPPPAPAAASMALAQADEAPGPLSPGRSLPIWPWLLAAVALGAGGAFLFWRRNSREAYAGPQVDAFEAPEAVRDIPAPAPPPAPPKPVGFVSSRMRPWIEIGFQPTRCIVEEEGVTFEFELELYNSGNAPARDVLLAVGMFNASPTQDQEIRAFFGANGKTDRLPVIPPLQRLSLSPQFGLPFDQLRMLEAGGRKVFVPLIAFNAVYGWGGGAGQSAAAYLVGRDTKGEKLAPFRADLGRRVFRGLGSRPLPLSVRN